MLPLSNLLERFKNITNTEKVKKQLIVEILSTYKITVTINQLSFSKNTIHIKTNPIIKTEILLKKEEFIREVRKIPGLNTTTTVQ